MARARRAKVKKYQQGPPIYTVQELASALSGDEYLWWRGKPYHPMMIANWSWVMIERNWKAGLLRYASITPEWISKELEKTNGP